MSSKSRQSREEHEHSQETESKLTPKPYAKVREASPATTERTSSGGALSHRLAKASLPLRRGQKFGTKRSRQS